jgi:CPA2 family monovalent cation:H+ antiporter-2
MNDMLHQLTWVAATAAALGVLMLRLKQPPMLGFMLAGLALGPTGLALVANDDSVRLFAELGVLLLLFVVALEISLRSLRRSLMMAAACAAIQATAALAVTMVLGGVLGWPWTQSLVIGFVLSLSSTAVGIKLLESVGEARREPGRLAVSVLVAQDVLVIPMLLITTSLGAASIPGLTLSARILVAVGTLAGLIAFLSRRERLKIPFADAIARNADAGPLAALAVCLLGATAATLIGISPIYGAFVAGLVVGASNLRHTALRVSIPVQSILLMVFFLSIGLMLDLRALAPKLPAVLIITVAVLVARTAVNAVALRLLKAPPREALIAAVAMAPLGEFGFVLAAAGLGAGAITADGYQIALAVIAISMAASPLWMLAARRAVEHRDSQAATARAFFDEIFADELAASKRWLADALARTRAGAARGASLGKELGGAVAVRAREAARRAMPRPANDTGSSDLDDPTPGPRTTPPPPPDVPPPDAAGDVRG